MSLTKRSITPRKEPNQQRARETVENIVKATAHILEKEGIEKASTNKIAAKAGVSIGSLYQYFPTKEAILSLMMERYTQNEFEIIDKVLKERKVENLHQTIRAIIEAIVESKRKQARFTRLFAQYIFTMGKLDLMKKTDANILRAFKEHIRPYEHELRTENVELSLYFVIQSVKVGLVAVLFHDEYRLDDPRVVDELVHMAYSYLKKS